MKKSKQKNEFKLFQKLFMKWVLEFGLTEYDITFEYLDTPDYNAYINANEDAKIALVRLSSGEKDKSIPFLAKHEAIHLLLSSLKGAALDRFTTLAEVNRADETLVNKLENLING